jgi:hypothetical protein
MQTDEGAGARGEPPPLEQPQQVLDTVVGFSPLIPLLVMRFSPLVAGRPHSTNKPSSLQVLLS